MRLRDEVEVNVIKKKKEKVLEEMDAREVKV